MVSNTARADAAASEAVPPLPSARCSKDVPSRCRSCGSSQRRGQSGGGDLARRAKNGCSPQWIPCATVSTKASNREHFPDATSCNSGSSGLMARASGIIMSTAPFLMVAVAKTPRPRAPSRIASDEWISKPGRRLAYSRSALTSSAAVHDSWTPEAIVHTSPRTSKRYENCCFWYEHTEGTRYEERRVLFRRRHGCRSNDNSQTTGPRPAH